MCDFPLLSHICERGVYKFYILMRKHCLVVQAQAQVSGDIGSIPGYDTNSLCSLKQVSSPSVPQFPYI